MLLYACDYDDWLPTNDSDMAYGGTSNYAEYLFPHRLMQTGSSGVSNPSVQPYLAGLASAWRGDYLGEKYVEGTAIPDVYYCPSHPFYRTRPAGRSAYSYRGIHSTWACTKSGSWYNCGNSDRTSDPVEAKIVDSFRDGVNAHGGKSLYFSNVAFSDSRVVQTNADIAPNCSRFRRLQRLLQSPICMEQGD